MATRALSMHKIRELIRLKYEARLSHEQIARALLISKGVVAKYVARVERTGLERSVLLALSDAEVLKHIARTPRVTRYGGRLAPDFAHVHAELRRPNVTLMLLWQEYQAANVEAVTYSYSQFAELYRHYVATLRRSMRQVHRAGENVSKTRSLPNQSQP
jgi:transposase